MLWMILVLASLHTALGLRILSVLPFPQISHQVLFNTLFEELIIRGHEITVFSGHRLDTSAENYKHYHISSSIEQHFENITFEKYKNSIDAEVLFAPLKHQRATMNMSDEVLSLPHIQTLIRSDLTFDVLLLETVFGQEALLGLSYRFNAPVVTLNSFGSYSHLDSVMGNPNPLAYLPSLQLPYNSQLSFFQRVRNLILYLSEQYYSHYRHIPHQEAVMIKHFRGTRETPLPPLTDMLTNLPLVLLNSQPEVTHVRAYVPNMINVGGLHIPKKGKPLLEAIQKFMDEGNEGVIYFSFGSSFKGNSLPQHILNAFISVFKDIPERVLWKIDKDPPNLPSNVMTVQWAPQTDILRHSNCKAFITHGGLLSLLEATHFGIPLIGIPLFAEQGWNVAKIEQAQIGIRLRISDISRDLSSVSSAIKGILQNPMYRRNIKRLSAQMRDRLTESPLYTAVHWVEYVAKHKGAPQLSSPARHMSIYHYFLIDVFLFLFCVIILVSTCLYILLSKTYHAILSLNQSKNKTE